MYDQMATVDHFSWMEYPMACRDHAAPFLHVVIVVIQLSETSSPVEWIVPHFQGAERGLIPSNGMRS